MMTEQYVQTVDVGTSSKMKAIFIGGIAALMASLAFLIVAILVNYWYFAGFAALFLGGFALVQVFESSSSQYIYGVSLKRLVISRRNNAHNTKRLISVPFDKIERFEEFSDLVGDEDIIACENAGAVGVYALTFINETDSQKRRILFSPDDYLVAFLKENLNVEAQDE